MVVTDDTRRLITGYRPKLALTIVAVVAYGALAAWFWIRFFRSRQHRYMLWVTIGCTTMAVGFIARIPMTNDPYGLTIYIVTTLFTLLSPCAFLAQDYYLLPYLASYLSAEDLLLLRSRYIGRIFLGSDAFTFLLQAAGGGMTAIESMATTGETLALVGLSVQCVSFGLFWALLGVFGLRLNRKYPDRLHKTRKVYWALQWTGIGIMVRCVFRVIEFAQGYSGYLRTHEWAYYVFDTLPLFLAICVWAVIWPPSVLVETEKWSTESYALTTGSHRSCDCG